MTERASALRANLEQAHQSYRENPLVGTLVEVVGGVLKARISHVSIGSTFLVDRRGESPLMAEVVSFESELVILLPFEEPLGLEPGAFVRPTSLGRRAPVADEVLGDVIDAVGRSLKDGSTYTSEGFSLRAKPPSPLKRRPIEEQLETSVRVVDGLLPFGEGQRVGLFAGSGVGKSSLLSQLVRGTSADVVVVALIGERGREVGEFVRDTLDEETRGRATIVVATSDSPPMLRMRAANMATALAEDWRARGKHCLLLVDSLTRYARALREAALLAGEPPARRGYPASVFAQLPCLLERTGQSASGAISAVYTVLVEGSDMEEPVADEVRGIVDGHWVLSRDLAERGHFPAVDVLASVSRVTTQVTAAEQREDMATVRRALAELSHHRDAIDLGIYQKGTSPHLDRAIRCERKLDDFLRQQMTEFTSLGECRTRLHGLAAGLRG
jgi:flagellum-specific ATP synthase